MCVEVKTCTKCHKTYPLTDEYFRFVKSRKSFYPRCRECEKECWKAYFEANKERIREYRKEYSKFYYETNKEREKERKKAYYEANKEHKKGRMKAYYETNKEHLQAYYKAYLEANKEHKKEYLKAYYEANKERHREYSSAYHKANKERYRKWSQNRRSRIGSLETGFTVRDWCLAVEEFGNKCAYCGKALKLEQDHFVPVSKGGGYTKDNIVPACKHCNCSKHTTDFSDWYPSQPFYSKGREEHIVKYIERMKAV